jgi:hypothetical protein
MIHKYSNNIHHKKIVIIGPYPPPLGGISIHIKRVIARLQPHNEVHLYNTAIQPSKFAALKNLLKKLFTKPDIVYYHEPTESFQKLFITLLFKYILRYQLITIDHDCRSLYTFTPIKKFVFKQLIQKVDHAVVIGTATNTCYIENNITKTHRSIEAAFLPPCLTEEESILTQFPQSVHDFINNYSPLITTTVFAPIRINGQDLYGLDLCIELMKALKEKSPGLLCALGTITTQEHKEYFDKLMAQIFEAKLENNFYFLTCPHEFWPLIKNQTFLFDQQEAMAIASASKRHFS